MFESKYYEDIKKLINKFFANHFGILEKKIIFPMNFKDSSKVLDNFINELSTVPKVTLVFGKLIETLSTFITVSLIISLPP